MNFEQWWLERNVERVAALLDQTDKQIAHAAWSAAQEIFRSQAVALGKESRNPTAFEEGWNDAIDAVSSLGHE